MGITMRKRLIKTGFGNGVGCRDTVVVPHGEWDDSLQTLVIRSHHTSGAKPFEFVLPLNKLAACEQQLADIWSDGQADAFCEAVKSFAAFEEFATYVSHLAMILIRLSRTRRSYAPWQDLAEKILERIPAMSIETAWHLRFADAELTVEERFDLLKGALHALIRPQAEGQVNVYNAEIANEEQRELYWWMNVCLFELAVDCYEQDWSSSTKSIQSLRQASYNYVNLLHNEPYRQHLECFLRDSGSGVEAEIRYVLWLSDKLQPSNRSHIVSPAVEQEKLQRVFIPWFLKRYDWPSAFSLLWHSNRTMPRRQRASQLLRLTLLMLLPFLGFGLLSLSAPPSIVMNGLRSMFGSQMNMWILWVFQVVLQVFVLFVFFSYYQHIFRILAPRAFFASLLGFSAVFLAHRDVRDTVLGGTNLLSSCHDLIDGCEEGCSHWFGPVGHLLGCGAGCFVLMLPALLVAAILIIYQVTSLMPDGNKRGRMKFVLFRTGVFGFFCYFGAFFWGILFAFPLVRLCTDHEPVGSILWQVAFISSAYALMFGFLVQLLWEDRSAAEPMVDPL